MTVETCILKLKQFYPTMSPDEVEFNTKYLKEVMEANPDRATLMPILRDFANRQQMEYTVANVARLHTLGQHVLNIERLDNPSWRGDFTQAALSLFEETSSVIEGAGLSVEKSRQNKSIAYYEMTRSNIGKVGFDREFDSGAFDGAIADVIAGKAHNLSGDVARKAEATAAALRTGYALMLRDLRAAGISVGESKNYDGPIVHDGSAINGRFFDWAKAIDKATDLTKEFKEISAAQYADFKELINTGKLTEESGNKLAQILRSTYDKISMEDSMLRGETSQLVADKSSFAQRRARAKTFNNWKDGASKQEYLLEFGKYKTLAERYDYYARQTARDVSLANNLGADPKRGYEMLRSATENRLRTQTKKTRVEIEEDLKRLDIAYTNSVSSKAANDSAIAKFFISFRQLSAMAKLGTSGLTSIFLDPIATAQQRRDLFGEGLLTSNLRTMANYIPAIKDAAFKQDIADTHLFMQYELMTSLEELYTLGGGVMNGGDKVSKALHLASEMVSKGSGGYFFNKVSHVTNARMYMDFLSKALNNNEMTPAMAANLKKYGITTKDLSIVSKLGVDKEMGMKNIFRLSAEEFSELSGIKSIVDSADALSAFQDRMNGWLLEKIRAGAPIPGARERRLMLGDTRAGTAEGEFRRFIGQFKSTAAKIFIDSTYGSVRRSDPSMPQASSDFSTLFRSKASAASMGRLATHMTVAGVMYMYTRAMMTNNEEQLKRFEEMDASLIIEGFFTGGGGFFLGEVISLNDRPLDTIGQVLSPAVMNLAKVPYDIREATMGAFEGKDGHMLFHTMGLGKALVPGANFWFLQPFISGVNDYAKEQKKSERKTRKKNSGIISL